MKKYCVIAPSKGTQQFLLLKKLLGKKLAENLWNDVVSHQDFLADFKGTLTLDSEGIPTFESIMANPVVREYIGRENVRRSLESLFEVRDNTPKNYLVALSDALTFNQSNPNNTNFVAIVNRYTDNIKVSLVDKTVANQERFKNQFGITLLNDAITNILSTVGIVPALIDRAGINGITDFSKALKVAEDIIQVSTGLLGDIALSEEFAHLCLEVFKEHPLVERVKRTISNEETLREVLGDLYDSYEKAYEGDIDRLTDEAMGHMLQDSFFNTNNVPQKSQTLFGRLINLIKNFFKLLNTTSLLQSVLDARTSMNKLAKDILGGELNLTRERISAINRKDILYSLEQAKDISKVLEKITDSEAKMLKITKNTDSSFVRLLMLYQQDDADTALGIARYLLHSLESLDNIKQNWEKRMSEGVKGKFSFLRHDVRDHFLMYKDNIEALDTLLAEARVSRQDELGLLSRTFSTDGITVETLQDLANRVKNLNDLLFKDYCREALKSFTLFAKPFYGKNLKNPFRQSTFSDLLDDKGFEYYLEHADSDISVFDRWLSSMGNSSDVMLQVLALIVHRYKGIARLNHIEDSKKIQSAYLKAKKAGVTDFKFMYKYENGKRTPDHISLEEADKLPKAQRDYYNTYMEIKAKLDDYLDDPNAYLTHTILLRKDHTMGAAGLLALGKFEEAGEYFSNMVFEKSYDDLQGFGKASVDSEGYMLDSFGNRILDEKGNPVKPSKENVEKYSSRVTLKGFDGKEYMLVPKYYLHNLSDLDYVSDDPTGALIAYSFMAHNYREMDYIVDAMETGRDILSRRLHKETRGNKLVKEAFQYAGINVESEVTLEYSKTNIAKKIDSFFDSQMYGRYLKDEGVWHFLGKDINKQKLVSIILGASAHVQLGFNGLAQTASVANGIAMTNIEAAAGKYFKAKTLLKADNEYKNLLMDYVGELGNHIKRSKLALIMEYFDIKQDAHDTAKRRYDKAMLLKICGPDIAFLGQEAGDHWLYNRVALAFLMEHKGRNKKTGEEKSLYDVLNVEVDENGVGRLTIDSNYEFPKFPGHIFISAGRQIADINHKLFGIYNKNDLVAALQVALGRLAILYRKYLMPAMSKRFKKAQRNLTQDEWEAGYYRTYGYFLLGKIARGLKRSKYQEIANWEQSSPEIRENIRRARLEIGLFLGVVAGIMLVGWVWPDNKERPWLVKFLDYQLKRQRTELGALIPQPYMILEMLNIINAPSAGVSFVDLGLSLVLAMMSPFGYTHVRESGPYEGMNDFTKAVYVNTPYARNVMKFTRDIQYAGDYYDK